MGYTGPWKVRDEVKKRRPMTRQEVRAWAHRWEQVHLAEIVELQSTSPETRLRQLASLMTSTGLLGWAPALAQGEDEVRARWTRLRQADGVQK